MKQRRRIFNSEDESFRCILLAVIEQSIADLDKESKKCNAYHSLDPAAGRLWLQEVGPIVMKFLGYDNGYASGDHLLEIIDTIPTAGGRRQLTL